MRRVVGRDVWVLKIDHKHGEDITVHDNEASMETYLASYATEYWHELNEYGNGAFDDATYQNMPGGLKERIETYFTARDDEWYNYARTEVVDHTPLIQEADEASDLVNTTPPSEN